MPIINYQSNFRTPNSIIKTGDVVENGKIVYRDSSTGKIQTTTTGVGIYCAGIMENVNLNTGLDSDFTGDGVKAATSIGGIIQLSVTVIGASSAADNQSPVYMVDEDTYTLTKPANGAPCGFVYEWKSGTTCNVYVFDLRDIFQLYNTGKQSIFNLGTFSTTLLEGVAKVDLITLTAKSHFKILRLHAQPTGIDSGSVAGDQDLVIEINSVATTGGVLNLVFGDNDAIADVGTEIDATAITALNEAHAGDTLQLTMIAGGTGFTAAKQGQFKVYAIIEQLAGE